MKQRQVIRQNEDWRLRWRDADVARPRETQQAIRPAPQVVPRSASQSFITPAAMGQPSAATTVRPVHYNEPRRLHDDNAGGTAHPIRFASQQTPSSPFDDPFGDRDLPMPVERAGDDPPLNEAPRSPAPPRDGFVPRGAPQGEDFAPMPSDEAAPDPRDFFGDDESAPAPGNAEDPVEPPCDRKYNRRDCCQAGQECDEHRKRVRGSPISQISLDITPRMTITQLDRTNYDAERQNTMRRVPPRVWRDTTGAELADGRMVDFRHGRVEVETEHGLKKIPFADLSDDDMCFVTAWWSIPSECTLGDEAAPERNWVASTMTFKASSLCHKTLYFEDVNLERYGHSAGPLVQPVLSGAHFFANVAALPYTMGINPPTECRYPLGYYRPGDCAPWLVRPVPLSIRGGLTAAAAYVGGTFVMP